MELREVLGTWSDAANVHDYGPRFEAHARALHARLDYLGEPHVAVD